MDKDQTNRKVLLEMTEIYCKKHHNYTNGLCGLCTKLIDYSMERLDKCPKLPKKPICYKCKVSCYSKDNKQLIKSIMRYSGLRVFIKNPVLIFKFVFKKIFYHNW